MLPETTAVCEIANNAESSNWLVLNFHKKEALFFGRRSLFEMCVLEKLVIKYKLSTCCLWASHIT